MQTATWWIQLLFASWMLAIGISAIGYVLDARMKIRGFETAATGQFDISGIRTNSFVEKCSVTFCEDG